MNLVKCLNCGHEFSLEKVCGNDESRFTICPKCGSSFGTDQEVELSDRQIERIDEVHNAVYEMCKALTENEDLEWDMYFIGEIADFAANILVSVGNKVRYPAVVTESNGRQYIVEYHGEEIPEDAETRNDGENGPGTCSDITSSVS
ncbi:MAG: hypothetical protein NC331_08365 [Lachnospiraceae bacterium]|nr:hypothetical protein [Lachnospiraceae bacterium]MCM1239385.1 hypothetical protein [Lachnospiraceae bacterium]